jgi:hypothetical protein
MGAKAKVRKTNLKFINEGFIFPTIGVGLVVAIDGEGVDVADTLREKS